MKKMLIVENLNYDILNNINFSIKDNSITALIGKSSSGKNLLLDCIFGLFEYKGNIYVNGKNVKSLDEKLNVFSICRDLVGLENLTSFDVVITPLINLELDYNAAKKKVYNIFKKLQIEELMLRKMETLSYSEKKLISIARCLVVDRPIILLNNIFESLDSRNKEIIAKYLKELKSSTIIFTTENSEDLFFADNIIIMKDGEIVIEEERDVIFQDEKTFLRSGMPLPFIIDLSNRLKSYELIDNLKFNVKDMVDELWK